MQESLVPIIIELTRDILGEEDGSAMTLEAETRLFGKGGLLDSIGIVSLVVAVEQAVEDRFGEAVALADEKALSQSQSPYRTIGSLAEYTAGLMERGP